MLNRLIPNEMNLCLVLMFFLLYSCIGQKQDSPTQVDSEGWNIFEQELYDQGNVKSSHYRQEGKKESILIEFYENGTIKSKTSFFNSKIFGSRCQYDETGQLTLYEFVNPEGYSVFRWFFGKKGQVREGKPIYPILNKKELSVGEKIGLIVYLAIPDGFSGEIKLTLLDSYGGKIKVDNYEVNSNSRVLSNSKIYYFEQRLQQEGEYTIELTLYTFDGDRKMNYVDSSRIDIIAQ